VKRALIAAVALTAACGSTVQVSGQAQVGSGQEQGLGGTAGTSTGTSGVTTTGSSTGVTAPTGTTTGAGTTSPGSTGSVAPTAPGGTTGAVTNPLPSRGSATHEPIEIGFVTTSVGNAATFGVSTGQSYTDKAMYDALVAEYNLAGGIAGHRIRPVYGNTDTASSNWANQFAAVCDTFTQDHKVKAVIGYVFVFLHNFESCLAKARIPHLSGGYQPGDVVDQRMYPTLVSTGHPTVDGSNLTALTGALATGLLTTKTKLGLLIDTCANGDRAFKNSTEPWLKAHSINYRVVSGACSNGASDVSGGASAVSSAELQFASSGVDLVFANGIPLLLFMSNAESQGYHPQYLATLGGAALEANAPSGQMKNLHTFGWMPSIDVNPSHQPYPKTPAQARCIAMLEKHGLKPSQYNDFMQAYATCDGLELYRAGLLGAGSTEGRSVVAAVLRQLPGFQGASTYNGADTASARQRGGPAVYRETGWNASCSCMQYKGPVRKVPTP
jgi:ABC-type branched-subunit amino acid transport system substrate-binding protein